MVALQRGPLVFAAEWADNEDGRALNVFLEDEDAATVTGFEPGLLGGTQTISVEGKAERSYSEEGFILQMPATIKMIPYHLWNNRGPGEMRVWIPVINM